MAFWGIVISFILLLHFFYLFIFLWFDLIILFWSIIIFFSFLLLFIIQSPQNLIGTTSPREAGNNSKQGVTLHFPPPKVQNTGLAIGCRLMSFPGHFFFLVVDRSLILQHKISSVYCRLYRVDIECWFSKLANFSFEIGITGSSKPLFIITLSERFKYHYMSQLWTCARRSFA